jgi:outer membrane receptor protein involved in Fe transport
LLLLDGKRLQPSNPDGSVDLNIIPEALIGNVEVITGGASTAYGSDATAGVVNFILKRNFSGVTVASQYGVSDYGDGETFRTSITAGDAFAEGRGRAVISLDYSMRDVAYQSKRDYYFVRNRQSNTAIISQGAAWFGSNRPTLSAVNDIFVGQYGVNRLQHRRPDPVQPGRRLTRDEPEGSRDRQPLPERRRHQHAVGLEPRAYPERERTLFAVQPRRLSDHARDRLLPARFADQL